MVNDILYGDCLDKMELIEKNSIDLIYLDPPFFTEKKHTLTNRERTQQFSFNDSWGSNLGYAKFLEKRLELMHSLLKDSGSIFVHCDKSGEHIIRGLLDHIFGAKNFQSEIIWAYKRWSNSKKGLLPSHQNIYFYSKTKDFKFNTLYKPYSETTNIDQILQRRTRDSHNKSVYDKDSLGNSINGAEKKGVPLSDVWDIPYLNPKAKERVGYPTQKPLLLLEQVINLVTTKGDIVLDPFCGSGTTCVAAKLLGRDFIGIDESLDAVNLSKDRIDNPIKTESNLLKNGRDSYNNVDNSVFYLLKGVEFNPIQRNKGIDAILIKQHEGTPVLVKVQKDDETLGVAIKLLSKAMKTKKAKKAFLIQTSDENELYKMDIENIGISIIISPALELSRQLV